MGKIIENNGTKAYMKKKRKRKDFKKIKVKKVCRKKD